jgi:hypothetical protein
MPLTVIHHPKSMPDLTAWDGSLISDDATRIVISDGVRTMEFVGAFTYDIDGNVFGTLNEFHALLGGVSQYRVSSLNVDANQVYLAVQVSDVAGSRICSPTETTRSSVPPALTAFTPFLAVTRSAAPAVGTKFPVMAATTFFSAAPAMTATMAEAATTGCRETRATIF